MTLRGAARSAVRFVTEPRLRSEVWTRLLFGDRHFQGATTTLPNRYPLLFDRCAEELREVAAPRVLSFGCSTGEECFELAARMPRASIIGVDINAACLRVARRRNPHGERVRFLHRISGDFEQAGPFDAGFAMAVFQRSESRNGESRVAALRFDSYQREIETLSRKLKPGGLFFIDHCDFRFEDCAVAADYQSASRDEERRWRRRPLFGRDGRRLADRHLPERVFRKVAHTG